MRGCKVVACVVKQGKSRPEVYRFATLSVEQFGAIDVACRHVVEGNSGSEEEVFGSREQPVGLKLELKTLHFALVAVVVAHLIAHTPEVTWEVKERGIVVDALFVARKDMCSTYAEHVETNGREVGVQRNVAGNLQAVSARRAVKA